MSRSNTDLPKGSFDRLPSLAAELVGLPAALLVATGSPAAVAAKKATATIPIVFSSGGDPVQQGLVDSFPAGRQRDGNAQLRGEVIPKRLELLREVLPQPGLIAFLVGPQTQVTPAQLRQVEAAAQAVGQPILVLHGHNEDEIEKAFATMAERQVRGLLYGASEYFQVIADRLIALAARYRIPASYEWREFVEAGGLMAYSTNRRETMRIASDYAGRILKGAAPADFPVVQSTRFELVINLKTAEALGLTVPQTAAARRRGDRMINRRELLAEIGGRRARAGAIQSHGAAGPADHRIFQQPNGDRRNTARTPFLEGLVQQGFIVGRNVAIEYHFANGNPTSACPRRGAGRASGGGAGRDRLPGGNGGEEDDRDHSDRVWRRR